MFNLWSNFNMMKKTLVAIAALAAATGAFAQTPNANAGGASSVTIFGVADIAVTSSTADTSGTSNGGGSATILSGSGRNASSRLGFRGVEDLGGGLAAAFWLEAGINIDDGTGQNTTANSTGQGASVVTGVAAPGTTTLTGRQGLTFNRASTVSLIGKGFGEVRLGRDYSPVFWTMTGFDPFGTVGVGAATNIIGGALSPVGTSAASNTPLVRASNSIGWLSNNMGGFRAQVQYSLSEVATSCTAAGAQGTSTTINCPGASNDGNSLGARLAYSQGPLAAALAWNRTAYSSNNGTAANTGAFGDFTHINLGGSYNFGSFRLMGQYNILTTAATINNVANTSFGNDKKLTSTMLGVLVPVGATTFKASYAYGSRADGGTNAAGVAAPTNVNNDGATNNLLALGFQNDLSRRTAIYGTYSVLTLTSGTGTALAPTVGVVSGDTLNANTSGKATGIDVGIRHSF
jgi:predicted porin